MNYSMPVRERTKNSDSFGNRVMDFLHSFEPDIVFPVDVECSRPDLAARHNQEFYSKYYGDNNPRILVLGINPGRNGSGKTGISFTDSFALTHYCNIDNDLEERRELTSIFIYDVISKIGGAEAFYSKFFMSALFPFCLTREGRNFNYYDDAKTLVKLRATLVSSLKKQIQLGVSREHVIVIGSGKNYKIFSQINREEELFRNVSVLEHPRFIMQYRSTERAKFLKKYETVFRDSISSLLEGNHPHVLPS